ncbi:MAG TPA: 3-phosphoshikimate 1-carboxyvinyltransferase [Methanomicrobiales archaeon]|jgi:3-phosphoshikimate 1-carboxyvinyltransferase|nr:3-phosphoshikimate 1-carboxyvinyltransferase [Methanomicrobiales archaeon]
MEATIERVQGVDLSLRAPPSKSFTHRALVAASLARGESRIGNPLLSDDTTITAAALRRLGVAVTWEGKEVRVAGIGGRFPVNEETVLDLGDSGTSMRFFSALALLAGGPVVLRGSPRMHERPIGPLARALGELGGEVRYLGKEGYPPLRVSGRFEGGEVVIDGGMSSQFISALLMAAPCGEGDLALTVDPPPVSRSYLDITADVMSAFGAVPERGGYTRFRVKAGPGYRGRAYPIEGDFSSASYFLAIAAVCGGRVMVGNLDPGSPQGDRRFPGILADMGCKIGWKNDGILLESDGSLSGIDVDLSGSPDTVQTLCAVAAFARGPTRIRGIGHLRHKESDRIKATADSLRNLGGDVRVEGDSVIIQPGPLHGGIIDPRGDHRTAMAFAVVGFGLGGITIRDAGCVSKSFPGFWDLLRGAGLPVVSGRASP